MSEERNMAIIRTVFEEIVNQGNFALIDELYAPDVVDHDPLPGAPPGREGVRYTLSGLRAAFPDFHVTIEQISAAGDTVVIHNTWRGTQQGEFMGLAPTGREMRFTGTVTWRLQEGRIVERKAQMDTLSMLKQLGALGGPRPRRPRRRDAGSVVAIAFTQPILPGKLAAYRQFNADLADARREEHAASRQRLGVTSEMAWYQQTPAGDFEVVYFEVRDFQHFFLSLATSNEPFDRWFRERVLDIHGVDLSQPPGTMPEQVFAWHAPMAGESGG